jgi:Ca-activated chloride channel family protein
MELIENLLNQLHFIRPFWLLAIVPMMGVLWFVYQHLKKNQGAWSNIIEPHLLQALSFGNVTKQSLLPFWLLSLSTLILIIALSGPSFFKYPHQTFKIKQTLFIVLDLSPSMNATDIKPTRLKRSIFALKSLLKKEFPDDVSLIVFSAEPYLISPPTTDKKTILSLIDGINTDILPTTGSNLDISLAYVEKLIKDRPKGKNNILLLTDIEKISKNTLQIVTDLKKENTQISIISVATQQGAPIPIDSGLLKNKGDVIISRLNEELLRSITNASNGLYQNLYDTPNAIDNFLLFKQQVFKKMFEKQKNKSIDAWVDLGIWFSLLLVPFALLAFRRGYLLALPLFLFLTPEPQASLWQTQNQLAEQYFKDKNYQKAVINFQNPNWKASSLYKAKLYKKAQTAFANLGQTYNEGNALAKLGRFKKAIKKLQTIKKGNANYENALYNIEILKKLLKKQKQQQKKSSNKQQNQDDKKSKKSDKKNKSQQKKKKLSDKEKQQLKQEGKDKKKKKKSKKKKQEQNKKRTQKKPKKEPKKRTKAEVLNDEKKQQVDQELKKITTKPYGLLQRKFLIERSFRQQEKSKFYNSNTNEQW